MSHSLRYGSILGTIGQTPIVRLRRLAPPGIALYVKLESRNPGGSVKDRMALAAIEAAERTGALRPGQTVVEATSGNTGIALAVVCAAKGYPLVVTMSENFSVERRKLMRFLGARVVLTPAALKGSGMVAKARELAAELDGFLVEQFTNPANAQAHEFGTAREILDAFADAPLDCFVTGTGTGGTLRGVARALRRESPGTRIVVCEPDNAPVLASGRAQPDDGSSHPDFRPHVMQGWTPDFISGLTAEARDDGAIDQIQAIAGDLALHYARALAREEGILSGISGGATLAGAIQACQDLPPGSRVLAMLPDSAERYLSTPLFDSIGEAMDEEEWRLSRSTPGARFDGAPTSPAPISAPAPVVVDAEMVAELQALLADREAPVLLFALAWCEFCWAIRKLLDAAGIAYRTIELDHPDWQSEDRGGRLRRALGAHIGAPTIPQLFIAGQWLGGCSDAFDAFEDGRLRQRLEAAGVAMATLPPEFEARRLLPNWRQPVPATSETSA